MSTSVNNRKDIMLLLLYSPGRGPEPNEPIVGKTRLVKMIFLFKKEALAHFRKGTEISEDAFYEFFAWTFGPFSTQVYDDLNFFMLRDFVGSSATAEESLPESAAEWEEWLIRTGVAEPRDELNSYEEEEFKLTPKGAEFTASLYDSLSPSQRKLLKEFKARLQQAPLRAMLKYVYETYPEFTVRSKIKEEVLGRGRY
jgi:hypothetical protein